MASALLELSHYAGPGAGKTYFKAAETMLRSLSNPTYRSAAGSNNNFLLRHSVGSLPQESEVDVPLSYADYYYLEACLRYRDYNAKDFIH